MGTGLILVGSVVWTAGVGVDALFIFNGQPTCSLFPSFLTFSLSLTYSIASFQYIGFSIGIGISTKSTRSNEREEGKKGSESMEKTEKGHETLWNSMKEWREKRDAVSLMFLMWVDVLVRLGRLRLFTECFILFYSINVIAPGKKWGK